jgi:hypothetical protein
MRVSDNCRSTPAASRPPTGLAGWWSMSRTAGLSALLQEAFHDPRFSPKAGRGTVLPARDDEPAFDRDGFVPEHSDSALSR